MSTAALQHRLATLRAELATGETRFQQLEREASALRDTLLRITGAIQVIEELMADERRRTVIAEPPQ